MSTSVETASTFLCVNAAAEVTLKLAVALKPLWRFQHIQRNRRKEGSKEGGRKEGQKATLEVSTHSEEQKVHGAVEAFI